MAPLTPTWKRPSHPDVQEVIINEAAFTSKSISKVALPPFALFAKMDFPPCSLAPQPTYATVQMGKHMHLNLNSDLLYINHSCEPSLIFDTANLAVLVGPNGLKPGDELTFFYPSTEWQMAQPFDCLCGKPTCRGRISGASDMTPAQLEGVWLNGHIRALLDEQQAAAAAAALSENASSGDITTQALRNVLGQAEKAVDAARTALCTYLQEVHNGVPGSLNGGRMTNRMVNGALAKTDGLDRRGPTSRELSGEMGGDTVRV